MSRFVCAALAITLVLLGAREASASFLFYTELSGEGAATIINDGTSDVASSNGGAQPGSATSLMSALGLTDLSLDAGLGLFHVDVSATAGDPFTPATSATITTLRLYGTVADPCTGCATPASVRLGFSGLGSTYVEQQNVLFFVDLIGVAPVAQPYAGPAGLGAQTIPLATTVSYTLTAAQIEFITNRMGTTYGVGDVRLGLGTVLTGNGGPVLATLSTPPVGTTTENVPEPGSLLLMACGLAALGSRRLRRTRH